MIPRTVALLSILVVVAGCGDLPKGVKKGDMKLLDLILRDNRPEGKYTIVAPETVVLTEETIRDNIRMKLSIKEELTTSSLDLAPLVDALYKVNREPVTIDLLSDREKGYVLDKDGKFLAYFGENGGGWDKLYEDNPGARGRTAVSIPVVDTKNSIVLVYLGTSVHYLGGAGYVIAYRLKDGRLEEIGRVMVWGS